ncbi:unnamed protein product [Urochloa humidicola]
MNMEAWRTAPPRRHRSVEAKPLSSDGAAAGPNRLDGGAQPQGIRSSHAVAGPSHLHHRAMTPRSRRGKLQPRRTRRACGLRQGAAAGTGGAGAWGRCGRVVVRHPRGSCSHHDQRGEGCRLVVVEDPCRELPSRAATGSEPPRRCIVIFRARGRLNKRLRRGRLRRRRGRGQAPFLPEASSSGRLDSPMPCPPHAAKRLRRPW